MSWVCEGSSRSYLTGVIVPLMRKSGGAPGLKCTSLTPCLTPAMSSSSKVFRSIGFLPACARSRVQFYTLERPPVK